MHDRSECFTHTAYRNCTRISSSGEKPWEKPYQLSLTPLGEDLPKCGVPLLTKPGLLVLLFLGHPGTLVLFLGQFFPFEEQLPTS